MSTYDFSASKALTYYHGGKIVTADQTRGEDAQGNYIPAKAVVAADGKIAAVAYTDEDVAAIEAALEGQAYTDKDLAGQTMIPAFFDAHSHLALVGQFPDASPSAGATSHEALVELGKKYLDAWASDHTFDEAYGPNEPGGKFWFVMSGYDNTAFVDASKNYGAPSYAHPTKDTLDKISTEYPIICVHASNHLCVYNSLAMKLIEQRLVAMDKEAYANREQNWVKDENGEYNGIAHESGFFAAAFVGCIWYPPANRTPNPSGVLANAMKIYASYGITTVLDGSGNGATQFDPVAGMKEEERIVDFTGLCNYDDYQKMLEGKNVGENPYNDNNYRIGAAKIILDGSPQGKSAWFKRDDNDPSGGGYYRDADENLLDNTPGHEWQWGEDEGKKFTNEQVTDMFTNLVRDGMQFHAHANGTASIQQFIDCYRQALVNNGVDLNDKAAVEAVRNRVRPVVIHAQTITPEQMEEVKALGLNLSFLSDHIYYIGDYHLASVLGPDRGQRISPVKDALDPAMGVNVTLHQDSPIFPPNMVFTLYNVANRITRDGQPMGRGSADGSSDDCALIRDWTNKAYDTRDYRVSIYDAMKCVTLNSAWQNYEENEKGSIEEGKQANFAILAIDIFDPAFLNTPAQDIQFGHIVEETINRDKVIYKK